MKTKDAKNKVLQIIHDLIQKSPSGLSITVLEQSINKIVKESFSRRTLQRYLSELEAQKIIKAIARGSNRKYTILQAESISEGPKSYELFLSPESIQIRKHIQKPLHMRESTHYNQDFLYNYHPNETAYIPESLRLYLKKIGTSPDLNKPAGTFARHILSKLLVDLSWNSSRLEGNTYSLLETERLIQFNEKIEGKPTFEAQMILNHKVAIEFLTGPAKTGINRFTILNLHGILSDNLLPNPNASGRLRVIPVGIGGSVYSPLAIPQLIEQYFNQIIETAAAIHDPFEQAFFLMVQLPYLQSFEDVNKRVSRLAANIPLIRENLCPLSFVDVTEQSYIDGLLGIYEMNRIELLRDVFVWAYERSSARYTSIRQTLGEPDPFQFRYRTLIKEIVLKIVQKEITKEQATTFIRHYAADHLPQESSAQFINVIEVELLSLHEGNIARYGITPDEFQTWSSKWNDS